MNGQLASSWAFPIELLTTGGDVAQGFGQDFLDLGQARHLPDRPAHGNLRIELEHLARRFIGEQHSLFGAEGDDSFNHAARIVRSCCRSASSCWKCVSSLLLMVLKVVASDRLSPQTPPEMLAVFAFRNPVRRIREFLEWLDESAEQPGGTERHESQQDRDEDLRGRGCPE